MTEYNMWCVKRMICIVGLLLAVGLNAKLWVIGFLAIFVIISFIGAHRSVGKGKKEE